MKRIVCIFLIIASAVGITVALASCSRVVVGSGNVVETTRDVKDFTRISLSGSGTLNITQGDTESLRIEAEENILPEIKTTVRGGELHIAINDTRSVVTPTKPINYFVTVKDLRALQLSGSAKAKSGRIRTDDMDIATSGSGDVTMELYADSLTVNGSGSSAFTISGRVGSQKILISGSGSYTAPDLFSTSCDVDISGSGSAKVRVSKNLDVRVSGSGEVDYIGEPTVNENISGSGKVTKIR
ncbi:MAG TPA: head GIN domain-containing protein [Candidatus Aquicultor sp.]